MIKSVLHENETAAVARQMPGEDADLGHPRGHKLWGARVRLRRNAVQQCLAGRSGTDSVLISHALYFLWF